MTFQELLFKMEECAQSSDQEAAHFEADEILIEVALNTTFTAEQRQLIVSVYESIGKWYA